MRRSLVALALAVSLCGCRARTEIVLGVITDLKAPDLLDEVDLLVTSATAPADAPPLVEWQWTIPGIPNQPFILPGSFGLYSSDGSEPRVKMVLTGLRNGQVKVTRTSVTSLINEKTLFLRQSLVAGCVDDTDCKDANNQTCVEGECVDDRVDAHTLPKFTTALIDQVECDSGSGFLNTSTNQIIPPVGGCGGGQYCQEGTCYLTPTAQVAAASWHGLTSGTMSDLTAVTAIPVLGSGGTPTGSALYAVGKQGTIVSLGAPIGAPAAASAWAVEPTGTTSDLFAVWGESADLVYAVGAGGTLLVRDSSGWHPDTTAMGLFTGELHGIWGSGGEVWVVGGASGQAVAYHFQDGWSSVTLPAGTGELRGVFGTSANDVWMVGKGGALLHWDGASFTAGPSSTEDWSAVWASPSQAYVAASSGKLYALSPAALTPLDLGDNANPLTAIFGFGPDDIYVVGNGGAIFHGGPVSFVREYSEAPTSLAGVAGTSPIDVYAVGTRGAILHTGGGTGPSPTDGGVLPDLGMQACAATTVSTLASGMGPPDAGPTNDAAVDFQYPEAMAYDGTFLWVIDANGNLFQVSPSTGVVSPVNLQGSSLPGALHMVAYAHLSPTGAPDGTGLWVSIPSNNSIVGLVPYMGNGLIVNIGYGAGAGFRDGVSDGAQFNGPIGIAIDPGANNLYIADANNYAIRKIDLKSQLVSTLAGSGSSGNAVDGTGDTIGDGGVLVPGTARFQSLDDLAYDAQTGKLYVSDSGALRQVDPVSGDTVTLATPSVTSPFVFGALASDAHGNLYSGTGGQLVRFSAVTHAAATLVSGSGGTAVDGNGCLASLGSTEAVVADPLGQRAWTSEVDVNGAIHTIIFPPAP